MMISYIIITIKFQNSDADWRESVVPEKLFWPSPPPPPSIHT